MKTLGEVGVFCLQFHCAVSILTTHLNDHWSVAVLGSSWGGLLPPDFSFALENNNSGHHFFTRQVIFRSCLTGRCVVDDHFSMFLEVGKLEVFDKGMAPSFFCLEPPLPLTDAQCIILMSLLNFIDSWLIVRLNVCLSNN